MGCNDGSLLNEFKNLDITKLIGIEPTDTYKYAKKKKIKTVNEFFNLKSSIKAKKDIWKSRFDCYHKCLCTFK